MLDVVHNGDAGAHVQSVQFLVDLIHISVADEELASVRRLFVLPDCL